MGQRQISSPGAKPGRTEGGRVQVYTHEDDPANSKLSNWEVQKCEEKGRTIKIEWKIRCRTTEETKELWEEKRWSRERAYVSERDRKKGARIPKGDRPLRAPDPILSPAKCIISGEKKYEVISAWRGCSRQAHISGCLLYLQVQCSGKNQWETV